MAQRTTEGRLVWHITRAERAAAVVISPEPTRAVLAANGHECGEKLVAAGDGAATWEISCALDELCGHMFDFSELESLQLQ